MQRMTRHLALIPSLPSAGGWNVDEMENHGTSYDTRFKVLRERVLAMKLLWTQEAAEFHAFTYVNIRIVYLQAMLYDDPMHRGKLCAKWALGSGLNA